MTNDRIRILRICASDEPRPLVDRDAITARALTADGYLELLPGCHHTWGITDKGQRALDNDELESIRMDTPDMMGCDGIEGDRP